jgi:hypothetical protein
MSVQPKTCRCGEITTRDIHVVFDGPPGPVAGRFVETETPEGNGVGVGTWVPRLDGWWALRIVVDAASVHDGKSATPEPAEPGPDEVADPHGNPFIYDPADNFGADLSDLHSEDAYEAGVNAGWDHGAKTRPSVTAPPAPEDISDEEVEAAMNVWAPDGLGRLDGYDGKTARAALAAAYAVLFGDGAA